MRNRQGGILTHDHVIPLDMKMAAWYHIDVIPQNFFFLFAQLRLVKPPSLAVFSFILNPYNNY